MTIAYTLAYDLHKFPLPSVVDSDTKYQVQLNSTTVSSLTLPGSPLLLAIIKANDYCWYKFDADPTVPSSTTWTADISELIQAGETYFVDLSGKTDIRFVNSDSSASTKIMIKFYRYSGAGPQNVT